jgi:hypothetical protein
MPSPTEQLKADIAEIETLVTEGIIDKGKAEDWKKRLVAKFEVNAIPTEPKKDMPGDLAHIPGRLVGGLINAVKKMPNIGENVMRMDREMNQSTTNSGRSVRRKEPDELLKDLPDRYK